ncbi:exopolysaccharide biosynthesis polyprenyl glycosylphosphotransferase [Myceligenerans xiligouense]|uniref:Exopolysaccharide biosynthesis polyprenyl glycosylphosphotransferase n=2 Tax=Myceligenerans xiligouense TaxID=253184 RepID=A0A3N4YTI7_9MICO|nr:exopolysaccharide biosynthesis polyprenyl glycosylphosphotransferase [Myceligenerans xiligouense]
MAGAPAVSADSTTSRHESTPGTLPASADDLRTLPARWWSRHRVLIRLTDALALTAAGAAASATPLARSGGEAGPAVVPVLLAVVAGWLIALEWHKSYDWHLFGGGMAEYRRVLGATWKTFALVAIAAWLTSFTGVREVVLVAFLLGTASLLGVRFAWRRRILRLREQRAACVTDLVAVGHRAQVSRVVERVTAAPHHGLRVVGACVPAEEAGPGDLIDGIPVLGTPDEAGEAAERAGAGAVVVSGSQEITSDVVRRLGWALEERGIELMLTTELTDIAPPRVSVSRVPGMSLLHVAPPRFTGPKYVVKQVMDGVLALVLTVLTAPVIAVLALAVVLTSRGSPFYVSERVGRDGRIFSMVKLRTMHQHADRVVPVLSADDGAGVLFKMREDPRVTSIGRVLRRYSLDELPQLFNVLAGHMSLVGPRPPLPHEAAEYEERMRRRLLVKPGMTGLWQVRGRSDLSWEETVRCDVYYAENWTLHLDLLILADTARAVITAKGAY